MTKELRIAIIGVGNCASSLVQGLTYYAADRAAELTAPRLGGYRPDDIRVVLAYDVDARKVGLDIAEAIFAPPNCTTVFATPPALNAEVRMGSVLDGVAAHMEAAPEGRGFRLARCRQPTQQEIVNDLRAAGVDVLVNYLPVGSEAATRFYMECALEAGVGVVNCIPVFIASDPVWAARFMQRGLPIVGDDVKAQFGATVMHRALSDLMRRRGVKVRRTYQLNTGGNTDFLNMLDRSRVASKSLSKTRAVQSALAEPLPADDIHVGPSDYVPWLNDNKLCFVRLEGELFGGVPMNLEVRLSVEDSPNSAGVVIDALRCCGSALARGIGGPLPGPSALYCKHPPQQYTETEAELMVASYLAPSRPFRAATSGRD